MKNRKYYTQVEVDEYVRKLLTDSEIALSKQAERIEKEKKAIQKKKAERKFCLLFVYVEIIPPASSPSRCGKPSASSCRRRCRYFHR